MSRDQIKTHPRSADAAQEVGRRSGATTFAKANPSVADAPLPATTALHPRGKGKAFTA